MTAGGWAISPVLLRWWRAASGPAEGQSTSRLHLCPYGALAAPGGPRHLCHQKWPGPVQRATTDCWLTPARLPGVELQPPKGSLPTALPRYQQLRPRLDDLLQSCARAGRRWPVVPGVGLRRRPLASGSPAAASPATDPGCLARLERFFLTPASEPPHPSSDAPPFRFPAAAPNVRAWCCALALLLCCQALLPRAEARRGCCGSVHPPIRNRKSLIPSLPGCWPRAQPQPWACG